MKDLEPLARGRILARPQPRSCTEASWCTLGSARSVHVHGCTLAWVLVHARGHLCTSTRVCSHARTPLHTCLQPSPFLHNLPPCRCRAPARTTAMPTRKPAAPSLPPCGSGEVSPGGALLRGGRGHAGGTAEVLRTPGGFLRHRCQRAPSPLSRLDAAGLQRPLRQQRLCGGAAARADAVRPPRDPLLAPTVAPASAGSRRGVHEGFCPPPSQRFGPRSPSSAES